LSDVNRLQFDFSPAFKPRKTPLLLQSEMGECGVACLAMVAGHFGHRVSLVELRQKSAVSQKGQTLASLIAIAEQIGLAARPVRLELDELERLQLPAILHWNLSHFVVLTRVRSGMAWINDPAIGVRRLSLSVIDDHFTGVALELKPSSGFHRKATAERVRLTDFFDQAHGLKSSIFQMIILAAVLQAVNLTMPLMNQSMVDNVISRGDTGLLNAVAVGMIFLIATTAMLSHARSLISVYLRTQLQGHLQTNLYRHILSLPVSWFEKRQVGDIVSRFSSLGPVQSLYAESLPAAILDVAGLVFAAFLMAAYAPVLMALQLFTIGVILAGRILSNRYYRRTSLEGLSVAANAQSIFLETIRGARTIKAFGKERSRLLHWQNEQVETLNNSVRLAKFSLWGTSASSLMNGLQQTLTWYIGALFVIRGDLTLGMLFAFQAYAGQFSSAAMRLVGQVLVLQTAHIHLERLADIVHAEPEAAPTVTSPALRAPDEVSGTVELQDVSFRYADHEPWILQGLSLVIRPGEFVCITGPSGHGKSTLLKLLLGFYPPTQGLVRVDGQALTSRDMSLYRSEIGVVLQDDQLFSGTIADNIAFFDADPDMNRVQDAARAADIHSDIEKLPMKYLSLVGDMGSSLSGGQKQRIFIARALYRKPSILFMDEGTANLDIESEKAIIKSLAGLPITRDIIAHREAMLSGSDRVLTIRDGQLWKDQLNGSRHPPPGDLPTHSTVRV